MAARLLATAFPYIIVGMLLLALALFVIALQQLRRGRTGPYWRLRRQAGERGGQLFLLSLTLFGVALALAFFSGLADLAIQGMRTALSRDPNGLVGVVIPTLTDIPHTVPATQTPTTDIRVAAQSTRSADATLTALHPTDTPLPTDTATPTLTPTTTLTPTITETAPPTLTATATFESVLQLTPAASEHEPPRDAMIELMAAASGIAPDNTPVEQGVQFAAGIQRLYFFVRYSDMESGVAWTRILYREGIPIQGQTYVWSQGDAGETFFFFGDDRGYPPGSYEVRLFIGADETSRLAFTIAEL